MVQVRNQLYPKRTTLFLLRGTFIACLLLGFLLIIYNGVNHALWLDKHVWVLLSIFSYLGLAEVLLHKNYLQKVNWMLIAFYIFLSFCTLLIWGLNAPIGILTVSFAVILPSLLMGAKAILPVTILSIFALLVIQLIHDATLISPKLLVLSHKSTYWDVTTYATILSIFALVSWLAGSQREKNLRRALLAEAALRQQKAALAEKLEEESTTLRRTQISQMGQLYKFALIGQSTAATLHELSTHLSILNFDIDDLQQQHSNSEAITNAKESIQHINTMVVQARRQLDSYEQHKVFDAIEVIEQSIQDLRSKFKHHAVHLHKQKATFNEQFKVSGNPIALMQIITILLNNALDACVKSTRPKVSIKITPTSSSLLVSIIDNGRGVSSNIKKQLFNPVTSSKSTGLGVGLYIAQHLAKDQFGGGISLEPSKTGANFVVTLPRLSKPKAPKDAELTTLHTRQQLHAPHSVVST